MCARVCAVICIHTLVHVYLNVNAHCTCMHACQYEYLYTCMYTCLRVCISVYVHVSICLHVFMSAFLQVRMPDGSSDQCACTISYESYCMGGASILALTFLTSFGHNPQAFGNILASFQVFGMSVCLYVCMSPHLILSSLAKKRCGTMQCIVCIAWLYVVLHCIATPYSELSRFVFFVAPGPESSHCCLKSAGCSRAHRVRNHPRREEGRSLARARHSRPWHVRGTAALQLVSLHPASTVLHTCSEMTDLGKMKSSLRWSSAVAWYILPLEASARLKIRSSARLPAQNPKKNCKKQQKTIKNYSCQVRSY